ncbi:MAG: acylphosphatase [Hyperthermus sp.]|nr:MAG: acylphosphatase [Hyperthermus sp.]
MSFPVGASGDEKVRAYIRIYGVVQGVFFRANMQRVARSLGVNGWVRNVADGSVEALVEGERAKVEELIKWALRGPPAARVERVIVEFREYRGDLSDFVIRY